VYPSGIQVFYRDILRREQISVRQGGCQTLFLLLLLLVDPVLRRTLGVLALTVVRALLLLPDRTEDDKNTPKRTQCIASPLTLLTRRPRRRSPAARGL